MGDTVLNKLGKGGGFVVAVVVRKEVGGGVQCNWNLEEVYIYIYIYIYYMYITNPSPNKFNSIININISQTKLCKFKIFFIIFTSQRFGACPFFKDEYHS